MEGCIIVIICIVAYVLFKIAGDISCAIEAKNARIQMQKNRLDEQVKELNKLEQSVENMVKGFFSSITESTHSNQTGQSASYASTYNGINNLISRMQSVISQMERINEELISESHKEDQRYMISQEESRAVSYARNIAEGLNRFGNKVYAFPVYKMLDINDYGKINKAYWEKVCNMQRTEAVTYIADCERLLGSKQINKIFAIELEEVLKCVWFFAIEKDFSTSDFQKAVNVFLRIHRYNHADVIIADFYTKKKLGGDEILRDPIRELLKNEQSSDTLTLVASGLMWMNAYQSENIVLQHMLTSGKNMTTKMQERLHSLTNGGGKAPSGFDVESSNNALYFDISALAWKDDEYVGLFENLAFQDKTLTYSLAIRDEDKNLFIAQGINVPDIGMILKKFKDVFTDEYGTDVVARIVNCIALSGSGEEKMDGILVSANECKQMGILIHIARIGKKLIIKFYTLFMPTDSDITAQKQQAMSMYKKLSPSVAMWESSLKDTMLMAIEQLLNASVQPGDLGTVAASEYANFVKQETIF